MWDTLRGVRPPEGSREPVVPNWRAVLLRDLARRLTASARAGPPVVAVDGRSAGGKSTFAARLASALPGSAVVHTDVAWNHSITEWADELTAGVLTPARCGEPVRYRPPGWVTHGRDGAIVLPGDLSALIVEGVGAGRRSLAPRLDAVVWVASDAEDAHERGIRRDVASGENGENGDEPAARAFWDHWMRTELPFQEAAATWSRATAVVAGTAVLDLRPDEVAVADPAPR